MQPSSITSDLAPSVPAVCEHCGDAIGPAPVFDDGRAFCCSGCKTVYEILSQHDLCEYYRYDKNAGVTMKRRSEHQDEYAVLDDPAVSKKVLTFASAHFDRVVWTVPSIHCASCVWLLERFDRLEPGVLASTVDILRKRVTIDFDPRRTSLREIAECMASIGYAPLLRLEGEVRPEYRSSRNLYARIGIAGFAAGNTMMMYLAQYFAGSGGVERPLLIAFRFLSVVLSIPVFFYCAFPWFQGARAALRGKKINLDVPVALGIAVLFARSVVDIATGHGEGFLDSFNGLVFFLLIGRLFQQKAFDALSFDRTYRSFFPLSVRLRTAEGFTTVPIERIEIGSLLSVRNGEVIPCDSVLESESGYIDYSFVTGESVPVECTKGETVYAGGRVIGRALDAIAVRAVSHSALAAMWDRSSHADEVRSPDDRGHRYLKLQDAFGQWFTVVAMAVACAGAALWLPDWATAFNIFTAVLIVACPCALTLAAPITLGSAMGRLGTLGIYLKNTGVLLELEAIDEVVFDKTGTLTAPEPQLEFVGPRLAADAWDAISSIASHSTHPVSRTIAMGAIRDGIRTGDGEVSFLEEEIGKGIVGTSRGHRVAIGSQDFIRSRCRTIDLDIPAGSTAVAIDGEFAGVFRLTTTLRPGIRALIESLRKKIPVQLLSGDSDRDRALFVPLFGDENMAFECRPEEKLERVRHEQQRGRSVLMVGDGLNDAGAMKEAAAAIAVTDDTGTLVPACDVIMRAPSLPRLAGLLTYARTMKHVIEVNFIFSILYNAVGISLAMAGKLSPMAAAILMPVSSLTVLAISVTGARTFLRTVV